MASSNVLDLLPNADPFVRRAAWVRMKLSSTRRRSIRRALVVPPSVDSVYTPPFVQDDRGGDRLEPA